MGKNVAEQGSERTKRLVNLIAYLMDLREPVTFEQIRDAFPGVYEGRHEAAIRKFERDKADLLDLGIPIGHSDADGKEDAGSYVVDRAAAYLPPIGFSPEEMAVLLLAGSALLSQDEFPYRRDLEMALAKIRLGRPDDGKHGNGADGGELPEGVTIHHPAVAGGEKLRAMLETLQGAVTRRKRVTFVYCNAYSGEISERTVDPYGLHCRRGQWSLVGHAHERNAIRTFLLHRMKTVQVTGGKPRTPDFELPDGFRLRDHIVPAWRYHGHDPIDVDVDVTPAFACFAAREFAVEGSPIEDGAWTRFRVTATNGDGLVEWALAAGGRARIAGPPEMRERARAWLAGALARYEGSA